MPAPHRDPGRESTRDPYHEKVWREIDEYASAREPRGLIARIGGAAGDIIGGAFAKVGAKVSEEVARAFEDGASAGRPRRRRGNSPSLPRRAKRKRRST